MDLVSVSLHLSRLLGWLLLCLCWWLLLLHVLHLRCLLILLILLILLHLAGHELLLSSHWSLDWSVLTLLLLWVEWSLVSILLSSSWMTTWLSTLSCWELRLIHSGSHLSWHSHSGSLSLGSGVLEVVEALLLEKHLKSLHQVLHIKSTAIHHSANWATKGMSLVLLEDLLVQILSHLGLSFSLTLMIVDLQVSGFEEFLHSFFLCSGGGFSFAESYISISSAATVFICNKFH